MEERLQPIETRGNGLETSCVAVAFRVPLNETDTLSKNEELSTSDPLTNTILKNENLSSHDLFTRLFEKDIVSILEKHFRSTDLIVFIGQSRFADLVRCSSTVAFPMRGANARGQQSVPIDEISKEMPNRIALASNVDRFHHA